MSLVLWSIPASFSMLAYSGAQYVHTDLMNALKTPCALTQVSELVDVNAAWQTGGQAAGTLGW